MQQLQNDCLDKPSRQSANNDPNRNKSTLEKTVHLLLEEGMRYGVVMNADKTKTMVFGDKQISSKICIDGIKPEEVEKFTYLGSNMTYDLNCSKKIAVKIAKTMANMKALDKIWKNRRLLWKQSLASLRRVFSTMLYGCQTWTVTKRCKSKILFFEKKCYRYQKILRIGWT